MKLIFLILFSCCFVAKSQTENRKAYVDSIYVDTCRYQTSWVILDYSVLDSIATNIFYFNGPTCMKSDCNVYVLPECETKEFHFVIYNRWGEIQFESTIPGNGWYAYNNEDGTYIWQMSGVYLSGEKFKFRGHLVLFKEKEE